MDIRYTNYNKCLTNVANSILKYYDLKTYHSTLKELDDILEEKRYKNIILMLYDGMGSNILKRNLSSNSFLNKNKLMNIDAVFPATTTASTTSVLSGKNPNEHGWLGWDLYFKEFDNTNCKYIGCSHIKETECGIKQDVENGIIDKGRYERFCKIYNELKQKEERKW